jgi:hypothetical protein
MGGQKIWLLRVCALDNLFFVFVDLLLTSRLLNGTILFCTVNKIKIHKGPLLIPNFSK